MSPSKELVAVGSNALVPIDPHQTLKASKALLAHIKKSKADAPTTKRNLLEADSDDEDAAAGDEIPIWLTLTTKRHIADKARLQPGKVTLPHPLNTDEALTICLITADPQRAYKNIVASDEFPAEWRKKVTRVIDFTKLKAKFGQYEAQRKLFSEHDIFLADDRIINRLPKVLGKTFFKTTQKRPIPVVLQAKAPKVDGKRVKKDKKQQQSAEEGTVPVNAAPAGKIAREIEKAVNSALISLAPTTNTAVRIGLASFTPEQIADNVDAVATALVEKWVPQKWRNVRSIHIKGPETAALPIWMTDELWLSEQDVVADGQEEAAAAQIEGASKKRKKTSADNDDDAPKGSKKSKKAAKDIPDGDDEQLDKQIADRKSRLRKQKAAAKKAMDD